MKTFACLTGIVALLSQPLFAAEGDWPDADAMFRDATRRALECMPHPQHGESVESVLKRQIAKRLAERGQFDFMFGYLAKYQGTDKEKGQSEHAYSDFVPIVGKDAFERGEFADLVNVLSFVPGNTSYGKYNCETICTALLRENRFDEAEKVSQKLARTRGNISPNELLPHQKKLYAVFPTDEKGRPAPKLYTIFTQSTEYHQTHYSGQPLAGSIFYGHTIPDQVWEAVDLLKEKKEDEAKALFDQAVEQLSEPKMLWMSGMICNTHSICGVAAFQIELGREDWAGETLRKAEACYEKSFVDSSRRFYPVYALANIMVALGKVDAARKLIEKDIPLHADLGTPLTHCDFAVALAESGDQAGAAEMLRNVMSFAEPVDHSLVLRTFLTGLFKASERVGDKDLCREFIDRAVRMAEKHESWGTRNDILGPTVLAQCWLEDFDGARKNLEKMVRWDHDPYFSTFVDSLIKLKRYDTIESFLREVEKDGRQRVFAWRAIALAKYKDGDKAGALHAVKAAVDSARNDPNGYTLGTPVLLVDIAMDLKYSFSEQPGRSPVESVDEILRWHQELMKRKSTDAADYTEEELLHFLRAVGETSQAGAVKEKLQGMGESVYPFIFKAVQERAQSERWLVGNILKLIDASKGDRQELRKAALLLYEKYPGHEALCEILGEVGLPEDVPRLLKWKHVSSQIRPAFRAVAQLATASQLPEIEQAAEEAKRLYFKPYLCEKAEHFGKATEYWDETLNPVIEQSLQTIREKRK